MKLRVLLFSAAISILTLAAVPAAAQTPTTNTVAYNGFSFSYDASLAGHVDIDEVAGDAPDLQQPGGPEVKHVQFAVSSAETTPSIFDAPLAIRAYNTADFATYPNQTTQFQNLQNLLSTKPDLNTFMTSTDTTGAGNLPFVPILPAAQTIRARAQYVTTPSVTGIVYVTNYRQDVSPFIGSDFFYTFQGYSIDGVHYVSAIFKLNTALFPAQIPSDFNMDTFNAGFTQYLQQSVTTLNSAQPSDFTPALATLDAIVQSFSFAPANAPQPTTQSPAGSDPTFGGLTQSNWVLASYGTAEAPIAALPNAPINLIFTPDGISGSAGCNSYFGQFHYDINILSFSNLGSTLIACTDPAVTTQETDYLNALRSATSYVIDNGVLKITYQNGILTFNAGAAPMPQATVTPVVGGNSSLGGLAGVNWVLSSFGPAAAPVAVLPGSTVTALFTTDGISGSTGCNTYTGNFTYDNATLTFTPFIATKMACTDNNAMSQETAFLSALQSATGYQITNGQLQIMYPDGVLTFNADTTTPTPSAPATPIVNTDPSLGGLGGVQWTLVNYGPGAEPVAVLPDAPVNIDFTQQGVSGSSGCNQYSGTFVYNNNTLTFSPLVSTQKACAENIMTQESAYLAALQGATGYQVAGNQLQISYPDGVLVFKSGA